MLELMLFAQATIDTTPSAAPGWVGASMLGAVLSWLMFVHIPATTKQTTSLIENQSKQTTTLIENHNTQTKELATIFTTGLDNISKRFADLDKERRADFKEALQIIADGWNRHEPEYIKEKL